MSHSVVSHSSQLHGLEPARSSVPGNLQARILKWGAIPFSRGSSHPRMAPCSPAVQADSLPSEPSGKPQRCSQNGTAAGHRLPKPGKGEREGINSLVIIQLGWSVFTPIPKKGNGKECSNSCTIAPISHASKVMLKIIQARLQQYVNS